MAAVAILGVINFLLWAFYEDFHSVDDTFEWVLTLMMLLHICVTHFAWKESGFWASFNLKGLG